MLRQRRRFARPAWLGAIPALLALGLLLASPVSADAATIVVNDVGEETTNNGRCTLLEAVVNANNGPITHADCVAGSGADTIAFNIPAIQCPGNACTIRLGSPYQLVQPVTIDGYTQPGASPNTLAVGNNAALRIELRGSSSVPYPLEIDADDVTVRGLVIGEYAGVGIRVTSGARARIVGCFIGTDVTGTIARPIGGTTGAGDQGSGIVVVNPAIRTTIGGTSPGDRNVISGLVTTNGTGVYLNGTNDATVQGNYIGLKANGLEPLPNLFGIVIRDSLSNTVGGTNAGARNVISGNVNTGICLCGHDDDSQFNIIQGNAIGVNAAGGILANGNGVIALKARNNLIGGTEAGAGNVIAGNTNVGVGVDTIYGPGIQILGNAIVGNGGLGIDLLRNGVTPNDAGDGDFGLQNFPVLTSVGVRVNTTVHGTLNSTPSRSFRIEVFSNTACDSSGNGEGETYLGFVTATTNASGDASFIGTFPVVQAGRFITATATDLTTNDTSEFSTCFAARQADLRVTNVVGAVVTSITTNETPGSFAQVQVGLTSIPTADVTVPISVSDTTEGQLVFPASPLTFTPANGTFVQQVRIVGLDDGIDDGDVPYSFVLGTAISADPNYNGLNPADISATNIDNDDRFGAMCRPRPSVSVSVSKIGGGQLRATVRIAVNAGTQNELVSIDWTRFDTASVVLDGVGQIQAGQRTAFSTPLTQSASFVITRTPGASAGTVRLTVTDGCGSWPTFVGGGPNAW
ncbi:MAG: right-handed parallel beta-helix repeat-containing protein [Chloroflexota bacterium]